VAFGAVAVVVTGAVAVEAAVVVDAGFSSLGFSIRKPMTSTTAPAIRIGSDFFTSTSPMIEAPFHAGGWPCP
jgi:hypothetical protein